MVVFAVCCLGLGFVSGAFDGAIAKLRSWGAGESTAGAPEIEEQAAAVSPSEVALSDDSTATTSAALKASGEDAGSPRAPSAVERNESAIVALNEGDFSRAIELLTSAVADAPEDDTIRENLGVAYLKRARSFGEGEFELALADFESALDHLQRDDFRTQAKSLMERAQTIAKEEAEFTVEETLHFKFKFDASRTEIRAGVDQLQILLEGTYQEYGELFGRRPVEAGEDKIAVVLYKSEGFSNVTGLGDWAGGAFDGVIRVPADDLREAQRVARLQDVLRHEVAHAFVQSIGGKGVPSWLNEGIAQWLENPSRRPGGLSVARARLVNARDNGGKALFRLSEIEGSLVSWSETSEITRAYDQALAFIDYLADQYGARLLFDMVAECKVSGAAGAGVAFQRAILVDLDVVLGDFDLALK
jgi:tetratricopeptide (TPR) repeat protein